VRRIGNLWTGGVNNFARRHRAPNLSCRRASLASRAARQCVHSDDPLKGRAKDGAARSIVHDYVVQATGAFDETVPGILRLKDAGQSVEVRVVLHAITAPRIVETCRWIARNLPFVDHVALMGLENTAFALANDKLICIDPVDYQDHLASAVSALAARVPVSIYNLPLCASEVHLVLRRSIYFRLEEWLHRRMR
jgi:hypothetical protein